MYSDEDYSVGQNGMLLSGGQRQKIAIARAIVRNNPIFIFDEATSNIDAETENMFIKLLKSAFSEKIVLLITHKKKLLEQMDTIVFFSNGKITSIGTHQELLTSCCFYNDFINQYVRAQ
ncbi:MAG: ATP-binding cassette domain-containing protein [bacterium]|nr:ATP-binding cassette domain-containing protein [bacterium]